MKNNLVNRITFVTFLLLTLSACSPRASFIPEREDLPDAIVDKPYFHKVNIIGGGVIIGRKPNPGKIEPDNSGLYIENCRLPDSVIVPETTMLLDGNCVEIKGTPVQTGTVKVMLDGMFYGNMFVSGADFEKTYLINIVAGKKDMARADAPASLLPDNQTATGSK